MIEPRTKAADDEWARRRAEAWLCAHLHAKTGVDVQAGVTDRPQRHAAIAALIRDRGLADKPLGHASGNPETYARFVLRTLGIDIGTAQEMLL